MIECSKEPTKVQKNITYVMLKALLLTNIAKIISKAEFRIVFDRDGLKGIFHETFGN